MCVSMNIKEKIRHADMSVYRSVFVCVCKHIDYGKGSLVSVLTLKLRRHPESAVSSELSLKTGWHQAEQRGLQGIETLQRMLHYHTHHNQTLTSVVATALFRI